MSLRRWFAVVWVSAAPSRALALGLWFGLWVWVYVCVGVRSADAMTLSFEIGQAKSQWGYLQYGQQGRNGFFGPYDLDNSVTASLYATLNSWVGNRPDVNSFASGSNVTNSQVGLTVDPGLGNEWLRVKGRYNINLYESSTAPGAFNPMSITSLNMWSVEADLPIFRIIFGKRPFQQGLGLEFTDIRTQEYLLFERDLVVPDILTSLVARGILPRGVLSWFNPSAWGRYRTEVADEEDEPGPDDEAFPRVKGSFAGSALAPATLRIGFGTVPWQRINANLTTPYNAQDVSAGLEQNWIAYLLYQSIDMTVGIGTTRTTLHAGPELVASNFPPFLIRWHTPTQELYLTEGWAFFAYNNGRFFGSAELDWFNQILRFQRTFDGQVWDPVTGALLPEFDGLGGGVSRFRPRYIESWRFLAEAGVSFGPSALKGLFGYMPGQDRRHGILLDRQPFVQFDVQSPTGVFDPYSMQLNYLFGGGVNAPAHISAATVWGAKADYMLAANLLVFGSFFKAVRNAHGYGLGYIRPTVQGVDSGGFGTVNYSIRGTFANSSPSIPDNDLGWEVTTGLTWQLAEGCFVDTRWSYWQPGKWFTYACIDRSVPNWTNPSAANNWGVNSERTIDPVYGIEIRVAATY
ncbi:MAG: hypothetical protein HY914_14085 [Desulfomonile tiedjei]|nr:hypothetical protein [Desulfomonile tiedjei]